MLGCMELEDVWAGMLSTAADAATSVGRHEIAEYLRLRASNDRIRASGVAWLFDTVIEIALEEQRRHAHLAVERLDPHRFTRGNSRMTGSKLIVRLGVRCLEVEAGWTRGPSDGVMSGRALAAARLLHFGMPRHAAELRLVRGPELPAWTDEANRPVDTAYLRRHIDILVDRTKN